MGAGGANSRRSPPKKSCARTGVALTRSERKRAGATARRHAGTATDWTAGRHMVPLPRRTNAAKVGQFLVGWTGRLAWLAQSDPRSLGAEERGNTSAPN